MYKFSLHRGDSFNKKVTITDNSGNFIEFDEIYFTLKKSSTYKNYIFQKRLSTGEITLNEDNSYSITILPEDTNELPFGDYVFDIEVYKATPLIKKTYLGVLCLQEEVTWASNE